MGRRWLFLFGATVLGLIALTPSCTSLPKRQLFQRLASLDKNRPLAEHELLALPLPGWETDLVHVRIPTEVEEPGRPVVMVHGTPSTLFTWGEVALGGIDASGQSFGGLGDAREVFLIEIPGHGVAPGTLEPCTFERCAEFVVTAVEALGLEDVHLVGQSYGGEFAWRAAANAPELFRSLVIMDSSGYPRREADWLPEEVEMRENPLADIGWWINSLDRVETALAPHFERIPPDRTEEFFLCCENSQNWRAMIDLVQDENGDRAADVATIQVPTLVVWGANDIAYEPAYYAQRFASDLPNGRLQLVEGAGHYPHEERPEEVVRLLNEFFAETED